MTVSRRDDLGSLTALGAGMALADTSLAAVKGAGQPAVAVPVAGDSVRPAHQPRWEHGVEGQRKPDLADGRYLNPIIPGNASDPDVVRDGDDYCMVFSSFDDYPGLPLYHSQDLVNWVRIGSAISTPIGTVLAPSISRHGGRSDRSDESVTRYTDFAQFTSSRARYVRFTFIDWPRAPVQPLGLVEFTAFGRLAH